MPTSIYNQAHQHSPPEDHIATISSSPNPPPTPSDPDFGLDSLLGLVLSLFAAPLYLYATCKGKFKVWDDILNALPRDIFLQPTLDVGCGRGMVLLKMAQHKKKLLDSSPSSSAIAPSYGIDIFSTADQTGNSPVATYQNAAAMGVIDLSVLHTASFTETFPFVDNIFGLVTANLSIHNTKREGRVFAVKEMARVCAPGGKIVIVDLFGFFGDHKAVLEELGWKDVDVTFAGFKMMYGCLPCQVLTASKSLDR
ncbi:hypothetical protein QQS21_012135 [Conoideocrella luteorostrata]|uniref:Methyltransferase type 11 domain-containing protein n=1 Tax=Conoideocrella luteorostrata TaxID=1105319 RepID=A0AAJ0CBS4_9HYPO|nr:hypothetical protein QQS21_012135 [Conoideocrella luteorostrata]